MNPEPRSSSCLSPRKRDWDWRWRTGFGKQQGSASGLRLAALAGELAGVAGVPLALVVDAVFFVDLLGCGAVREVIEAVALALGGDVFRKGSAGHVLVDRQLERFERLVLLDEGLDK